jgi:hypothetical protein
VEILWYCTEEVGVAITWCLCLLLQEDIVIIINTVLAEAFTFLRVLLMRILPAFSENVKSECRQWSWNLWPLNLVNIKMGQY